MAMLGKREHLGASCWIRMMTDLPMQLRDGIRLVHDLKTDKGMRGKGQGSALLKEVNEEADKHLITLILMPDSELLQKWYNKHGYVIIQQNPVLMMREPVEMTTRGNDGRVTS
jgi:ribosomal protein S18 acetylase RimI-like enzyme